MRLGHHRGFKCRNDQTGRSCEGTFLGGEPAGLKPLGQGWGSAGRGERRCRERGGKVQWRGGKMQGEKERSSGGEVQGEGEGRGREVQREVRKGALEWRCRERERGGMGKVGEVQGWGWEGREGVGREGEVLAGVTWQGVMQGTVVHPQGRVRQSSSRDLLSDVILPPLIGAFQSDVIPFSHPFRNLPCLKTCGVYKQPLRELSRKSLFSKPQ
ncbi:hypothetical protein E2C01_060786 [Portunus trituberculatus]|uniref:Uncharacterized protein n=1 Tax=Portunus trituberculatus TaxID=210409 RepID=A0A5B7H9N6_PORTR|nr:hypothetical protein [Portunus trituberculatus]